MVINVTKKKVGATAFGTALITMCLVLLQSSVSNVAALLPYTNTSEALGAINSNPTISADGNLIAFSSNDPTLVSGDTNSKYDVFLRNKSTSTNTRISLNTNGTQISGLDSSSPYISGNGKWVAWNKGSDGDTYLYNVTTAQNTLITKTSSGTATTFSRPYGVTNDGRFVLFSSHNPQLNADIPPASTSDYQLFVADTKLNNIKNLSVSSGGQRANANISEAVIGCDGRFVAFTTRATNLTSDNPNGYSDLFLLDRVGGSLIKNLVPNRTSQANVQHLSMSCDGNYISFISTATDLVTNDTNGQFDAFMYDNTKDEITRLSVASGGGQTTNNAIGTPSVSNGGKYAVFYARSSDMISQNTYNFTQIYLRDIKNNTTEIVSAYNQNNPYLTNNQTSAISANGNAVVFSGDDTWTLYYAPTGLNQCSQ